VFLFGWRAPLHGLIYVDGALSLLVCFLYMARYSVVVCYSTMADLMARF
jgi:hypothetical protein